MSFYKKKTQFLEIIETPEGIQKDFWFRQSLGGPPAISVLTIFIL